MTILEAKTSMLVHSAIDTRTTKSSTSGRDGEIAVRDQMRRPIPKADIQVV
jgi:hypothetical protein